MKEQVVNQLAALITAAFGLIAALAWNDAIKSLFVEGGALYFLASWGMWAYAVFVTILAVIMTIWIGNISEKSKQN
ncbi:MAG: hypothetical protein H5T43_05415 [Methanomethylovorans sp.]|nr:hypothetical protein [Methanomethylovorans sp.]